MRLSFKLPRFLFSFSIDIIKRGNYDVMGYSNRTIDGKYVVFIDYDNFKLSWILYELPLLATKYKIDHFLIFQSSKKCFHVVSLCKLTANEYMSLLKESSCDPSFRNVPAYTTYRSWILRGFSKGKKKKPAFSGIKTFGEQKREHSSAHLKFLRLSRLIPERLQIKGHQDNEYELEMIRYKTGAKVVL